MLQRFTKETFGSFPFSSLRMDREQHVPNSSNHSLYLIRLFSFSRPEGNKLLDCLVGPSPSSPSITNDVNVSIATSLHQRLPYSGKVHHLSSNLEGNFDPIISTSLSPSPLPSSPPPSTTTTTTSTTTTHNTQRQRQRQRQRLNAKRPACQSNQLTDASQNSLTFAELLRKRWAHVILSRSITYTLVYSPAEAPRRGEGPAPKQVVSVARVYKGPDSNSRVTCEAGCDHFR